VVGGNRLVETYVSFGVDASLKGRLLTQTAATLGFGTTITAPTN
jgi:hypothetical protein